MHTVTAVRVIIRPAGTPPGLPASLAADGNAYVIQASALPSGQPLRFSGPAILTLRFPHIPVGMDYYGAGWKEICENTGGAIITSGTISCQVRRLGFPSWRRSC
jgi:hypothetical protein